MIRRILSIVGALVLAYFLTGITCLPDGSPLYRGAAIFKNFTQNEVELFLDTTLLTKLAPEESLKCKIAITAASTMILYAPSRIEFSRYIYEDDHMNSYHSFALEGRIADSTIYHMDFVITPPKYDILKYLEFIEIGK